MQVILMRLMSKGEYLIVPQGTKFTGSGKLGLNAHKWRYETFYIHVLKGALDNILKFSFRLNFIYV